MLDTVLNPGDYLVAAEPGPAANQETKRDEYDARGQLTVDLEQALSAARPRLLRLAHRGGVTPDAADDVVQETLIEAWRHLNHLRSPERFDAWLDGICRNVVLRWARTQGMMVYLEASLSNSLVEGQNELEESSELDIPDPMALDPVEELSRQDLAVLLDRALGYLPQDTRALVELHYLAELPQDETAARIGGRTVAGRFYHQHPDGELPLDDDSRRTSGTGGRRLSPGHLWLFGARTGPDWGVSAAVRRANDGRHIMGWVDPVLYRHAGESSCARGEFTTRRING